MKKTLSLVLALALVLTSFIMPALAEDVPTVTWLISVGTTSDDNNLVKQEIEKRIGVRVEAIQVATGDFNAKLNSLIAAKTLPDIFQIGSADALEFIDGGMLMPLDDYLADAPNVMAEVADILPQMPANQVDGSTYMIGKGKLDYPESLAVRVDWLKNLNMEMPTTTDELYDVLHAFTYKDPDQNGKDDTIGIVFTMTQNNQWEMIFSAFGIAYNKPYLMEDGTVTTYMKADHYLDCIKYFRKLYQDGVMDPEFATMPAMTAHESLWGGRCGVYGFRFVGTTNNWYPGRYTFETPEDPAEIFGYTMIEGPFGDKGYQKEYPNTTNGWVVSSTCKNPEAAIKLIDYLYSEEGDELVYLGVEGVMFDWVDKANGKYKRLPGYEDDAAHRAAGAYTYWHGNTAINAETRTMNKLTQEALQHGYDNAVEYPYIRTPLAADTEYGTTLSDITKEALAQLIVSTGDIEAEYKAFVERWEEEGGLDWEKEATAAYNAEQAAAKK